MADLASVSSEPPPRVGPPRLPVADRLFWLLLWAVVLGYAAFMVALIAATAGYANPGTIVASLNTPEIRYSIMLSLITCTITAILSLLLAVPAGYLLSRLRFRGKSTLEAILDIPIVLPPMVVGICLLIFFQTALGRLFEQVIPFTYTVYGIVLAQFVIGAAFAIRTMRGTFDHISFRPEDVARTLGANWGAAFWLVTLPTARKGMFAAASVAWARSLGEFGPILVFAGATRMKTEVLPTTVWLELSVGNLEAAVAVSLLLIATAMLVLVAIRRMGEEPR